MYNVVLIFLLVLFHFGNCSSDPIVLQPTLTGTEKNLGSVRGQACGFLGILSPEYYFFPIGQNTKMERAYKEALRQRPGSKAIKNITIEEYWFWAVLGVTQCVTLTGEAIQ
ncbi:hypothetical protein [Leptospira adleri]|uniref:TRL-like family protein n=1 Tax=Leptospira adleri TaxID=2023186 RepID=A0A2M9YSV8_9LEPT|nr:hypothetical protein [Leptospira adleri]PJZ54611.1 hypothetical protein CH380_02480 [Leptospira adleri]PJZ59673.1 hypothetical protein CH376_22545 [Leptospira adleri]TGM57018.1 hypothetical protein EHQ97_10840 [Leptospira adleri]